jgi:hypothetical protein
MGLEHRVDTVDEDVCGPLEGVYIGDFLHESAVAELAADRRPDLVLVGLFV